MNAWNIEKYAFLSDGRWIQKHRGKNDMKLILQGNLLLVVLDKVALERVVVGGTNVRGLTKGTSMMILVANGTQSLSKEKDDGLKEDIRKFRVKFASSDGIGAEETKNSCLTELKDLFIIHDTNNENSGMISSLEMTPIQKIAMEILKIDEQENFPIYDGWKTLLKEDSNIEKVVHLCLLDPEFLNLVKMIEKTLMKKISL